MYKHVGPIGCCSSGNPVPQNNTVYSKVRPAATVLLVGNMMMHLKGGNLA